MGPFLKELSKIPAGKKQLAEFGWLVGGVLALISAYGFWKGRSFWPWCATPAVLLIVLGSVAPQGLKVAHRVWMGLALVMGFVMTRVILTVFYYLLLTPMAWFLRLIGQYPENFRKVPKSQPTYWVSRPDAEVDVSTYENQF